MERDYFQGKTVIITGASFGIGTELALQLAPKGAKLSLAARSNSRLEELASRCLHLGGMAISVPTDVCDFTQCQNLTKRTYEEYGQIDILINNAGIGMRGRFEKMQDTQILEKVMQVNFWGSVYCTFHTLPYIIETRGHIVSVSSGGGIIPAPKSSGYAASKHAMTGFYNSLRLEVAQHGVSVTMIYPDWVETGITSRAFDLDGKFLGVNSVHEKGAMQVDECARLILKAIKNRQRDMMMSTRLKFAAWFRFIFPGVIDFFAKKAFN